jgi:hypothetical protein
MERRLFIADMSMLLLDELIVTLYPENILEDSFRECAWRILCNAMRGIPMKKKKEMQFKITLFDLSLIA